MAKDQDDQITEFKIETGRGKQEKAVSCLSIISPRDISCYKKEQSSEEIERNTKSS